MAMAICKKCVQGKPGRDRSRARDLAMAISKKCASSRRNFDPAVACTGELKSSSICAAVSTRGESRISDARTNLWGAAFAQAFREGLTRT